MSQGRADAAPAPGEVVGRAECMEARAFGSESGSTAVGRPLRAEREAVGERGLRRHRRKRAGGEGEL